MLHVIPKSYDSVVKSTISSKERLPLTRKKRVLLSLVQVPKTTCVYISSNVVIHEENMIGPICNCVIGVILARGSLASCGVKISFIYHSQKLLKAFVFARSSPQLH